MQIQCSLQLTNISDVILFHQILAKYPTVRCNAVVGNDTIEINSIMSLFIIDLTKTVTLLVTGNETNNFVANMKERLNVINVEYLN